jgi:peptidoglycan/xylan/chitin deacetylase (PgdA/CDA1 family)/glycosyltransferase involved in cell wall biosynthesis
MPNGADPSFTIVIPTFQRRDLVCDALRALSRLNYSGRVDVIVVVDGATDGTSDALRAIELPFPIRILEQANTGPAAARNLGANGANGDIILFLDDDMIAEPDLLQQHARMYDDGADAVVGHIPIDSRSPAGFLADSADLKAAWMLGKGLEGPAVFSGQLSVRRPVFEHVGGFDELHTKAGRFGSEDGDIGVRLAANFDVRRNECAISRHRYTLTAREKMRRAREEGAGDALFARKYPQLTKSVFAEAFRPPARFLYRPLSRVPFVPQLLGTVAVGVANIAMKTRFRSSRLVANLFWGAHSVVYWSSMRANGAPIGGHRILVLCYHAMRDLSGDPVLDQYGIPKESFAAQLDWLLNRGFHFVTPDELTALISGTGEVPKKAVLLTFDDCYEELVDIARNVLVPRNIEAIAFAVSGLGSGTNEWDQRIGARSLRLLDPAGLRELHDLGVEVGCHSRSHAYLPSLADCELDEETARAADDLQSLGLPRPRFFAYPHGQHDKRSRDKVRDAGFVAAFGLGRGRVTPTSDSFALPRLQILARDAGWRFAMKTQWPELSALLSPIPLYRRAVNAGTRALRHLRRSASATN